MNHTDAIFDPDALKRVESCYRERLKGNPDDMQARVSLAWCLFVEALHTAGRESMLKALLAGDEHSNEQTSADWNTALDRDARDLLKDCLWQTIPVSQLSPDPQDHSDIAKLRSLVEMYGGEHTVMEMEAEASRILGDVARATLEQPSCTLNGEKRRPPRPER